MKLTNFLFVLLFLLSTSLVAEAQKKRDSEDAVQNVGIVYSLPQTGVRITVEADETRFYHGPYHAHAKSLLGFDKASSSDYIDWTISSISFDSYSQPDPNAVFTAMGWGATAVSLTEAGVLVGVNSPVSSEEAKPHVADFSAMLTTPDEVWRDRSMHSFINDDDTLSAKGWSSLSLEEKAMETAHDITKLRKRRFSVLTANYDVLLPDGKSYEVMVEELKALENEYVGLFIGKTVTKKHRYTFDIIPSQKGVVAFRFAPDRGVIPANDVSGRPIMLNVVADTGLSSKQSAASTNVKGTLGFNYRIPGNGVVRLSNGNTILAETRMALAQFGTIVPINDHLIEEHYSIEFHPKTGAIKSITPPVLVVEKED